MKYLTAEWLKAAQDDLSVIAKIIDDQSLTQMVAFHAEQAIEKSFKAIFEEKGMQVPKVHDIVRLQKQIESIINFTSKEKDAILAINELYIVTRYPGELGLLPDGKPSVEDVREFYIFAVSVFKKIKNIVET